MDNLVKANAWAVETRVWLLDVIAARKMENINSIMNDFEKYYLMDDSWSSKNPTPGKAKDGYFQIQWQDKLGSAAQTGKYQVRDIDIARTVAATQATFRYQTQHDMIKDLDKAWNAWLNPSAGGAMTKERSFAITHLNVIHEATLGE